MKKTGAIEVDLYDCFTPETFDIWFALRLLSRRIGGSVLRCLASDVAGSFRVRLVTNR